MQLDIFDLMYEPFKIAKPIAGDSIVCDVLVYIFKNMMEVNNE